jgi:signal transduction histidine kinase
VIASVLAVFSAAIVYANQARLRSDIDRELRDRAMRAPPEGPAGTPSAVVRFADVRRPRRFDLAGNRLGPTQGPPFDPQALQRAFRGESGYSNGVYEGEAVRIFTMPSKDRGVVNGAIQAARETRDLAEIWSAQLVTLLLFLPGALVVTAVGAFFLTGRAMRPIAQMKSAAGSITERDLSRRLEIRGSDEFAELGQTFNEMISRLGSAFANLQTAYAELEQAHEAQRRFNADASHELRTPLTRMRLATSSALADGTSEDDLRRALVVADQAAESMARLVNEMLDLARADVGQLRVERQALDLRVVASEALEQFASAAVPIDPDFQDSPVPVSGDRDRLSRVLTNLLQNAIQHTPASGNVTVGVRRDGDWAVLCVRDTGEGVPPEHLPHLGERFYRVDDARHASVGSNGLGLAICRAIAVAHGGTITFAGKPGNGFTAELRIPASS